MFNKHYGAKRSLPGVECGMTVGSETLFLLEALS